MLAWLSKNIATIIICLVLAVIVALIIYNLVKDKKKGKSSCGCNCAHCAMAGSCHSANQQKGKKAQLISTTEQKKGRSANCVLFAYPGGFFGALLI